MNKKQILVVAVVVILALLAGIFIWVTVDGLEKRISSLEGTVSDLGSRVEAIENKSWHAVGDFVLSPSKNSEQFSIQGDEWRLSYTFNVPGSLQMLVGYNLRVYNANGYIVGGLSGIELEDLRDSGKGILYIREGQGNFTVEILGINSGDYTFAFTAEAFY